MQLVRVGGVLVAALGAGLVAQELPGAVADPVDPPRWTLRSHLGIQSAAPARRGSTDLVLDDGSHEVDVGFSGATAFQFLWFNQFDSPTTQQPFALEEIQVLFPPGPDVVVGGAVELVVFRDLDADPTNGAELLATLAETIQVVDGVSFSVYALDPPVEVPVGPGSILIGVVNRFVASGVSPPSRPAALDTASSAGGSWVALWSGDPPDPPLLPPDDFLQTIDFLAPGNWMIRGSGSSLPVIPIPAVSGLWLAGLAAFLALAGGVLLRSPR